MKRNKRIKYKVFNSVKRKGMTGYQSKTLMFVGVAILVLIVVYFVSDLRVNKTHRAVTNLNRKVTFLQINNFLASSSIIRNLNANKNSLYTLNIYKTNLKNIGYPSFKGEKANNLSMLEQNNLNKEQFKYLDRLHHTAKLSAELRLISINNPKNLKHNELVKFNARILNNQNLGELSPEITLKNISARMLAEHEHYLAFQDMSRWQTRSFDLKNELSNSLDADWQNWLTSQQNNLDEYKYYLKFN